MKFNKIYPINALQTNHKDKQLKALKIVGIF